MTAGLQRGCRGHPDMLVIIMAFVACDDPECAQDHSAPKLSDARGAKEFIVALLPALACLGCPACLSAIGSVLAATGVVSLQGLAVSETTHHALLAIAVLLNVGIALWRSRKVQRISPLYAVLPGALLLLVNTLTVDLEALELLGVALLFAGSIGGALMKRTVPIRIVRAAPAVSTHRLSPLRPI
jgi:hypothetical protein